MIVIEATIRIIDYLIKLLDDKKRDRREEFVALVEPLYKDAEVVAKDYFQVLMELIRRLEQTKDIPSVVRWLEERRLAYLPIRIKMRAYLQSFSQRSLNGLGSEIKPIPKDGKGRFILGIQALLVGGLSLVEDGHIGVPGGIPRHTLLDILVWDASKPFDKVKDTLLQRAKSQENAIHQAWEEIVAGYVAWKTETYGVKQQKKP
jgi:hypothetical protein